MTPLERAARALFDKVTESEPELLGSAIEEQWFHLRKFYMERATIVLQAIREPSEAMFAAVEQLEPLSSWWPDQPGERNSPMQVWQAMIDAALEEE